MTETPPEPAAANNPAGRVLEIFLELQGRAPNMGNQILADSLALSFDDSIGSRTFMRRCLSLREQAYEVQDQMQTLLPDLEGAEHLFAEYGTVLVAADHIEQCQSHTLVTFLGRITEPGWLALRYANTILSRRSSERGIDKDHVQTYIEEIRSLIDQIQADDDITRRDRTYLVGLLEDVERSLREIRITGTTELRKTVNAAVGGLVTARGKSESWYTKPSIVAVTALVTILVGAVGDYSDAKQIGADLSQWLNQPAISASPNQAARLVEEDEIVDGEIVDMDDDASPEVGR